MWLGKDSDVSRLVCDVTLCGWVFRHFGTGLLGCGAMWLGKDSYVSGLVFWDVTLCGWVRIPTFRDWSSGMTLCPS